MDIKIGLIARQVALRLIFIVIGLVTMSIVGRLILHYWPNLPMGNLLANHFYLDAEGNIPAVYSAIALALASGLLFIIAQLETTIQSAYCRSWQILSGIFLYLSVDEVTGIHEYLDRPTRDLGLQGIAHYAWVVPGGLMVLIILASFLKFLLHLPRKTMLRFLFAGGVFIMGAIGFEILSSRVAEQVGAEAALLNPLFQLLVSTEESCEMLGVVAFIHAVLGYLNNYHGIRELCLRLPASKRQTIAHFDLSSLEQVSHSLYQVNETDESGSITAWESHTGMR